MVLLGAALRGREWWPKVVAHPERQSLFRLARLLLAQGPPPCGVWRCGRSQVFCGNGYRGGKSDERSGFPRVVLAAAVGALLALSGAALQGLFRQPPADPGLIGVTSGAGLGAAIFIALVPGAGALQVSPCPSWLCGGFSPPLCGLAAGQQRGRVQVLTPALGGHALALSGGGRGP